MIIYNLTSDKFATLTSKERTKHEQNHFIWHLDSGVV